MPGIYIHIPFCKQRCTYCDFYTRVDNGHIHQFLNALKKEIEIRNKYISKPVNTIYFGGGTPSLLTKEQLIDIFDTISENFQVSENAEITLEANPDDLSEQFLTDLKLTPVNRLSIGIQSFNDEDLQFMHRRHTAKEAINAVQKAQTLGFNNISVDLIYGLPGQTLRQWNSNLAKAFDLNIQHISAYGLTYEKGTPLYKQREKGILNTCTDDSMNRMFTSLLNKMKQNGFEAYEISNFAKPGFRSKHNSSYWKQESYLGLGPSAHSYNGISRQWNIASIKKYIDAIENNTGFFETEILTKNDRYNDYIMVSLRTSDGVDLNYITENFEKYYSLNFLKLIESFIKTRHVIVTNHQFTLSEKGISISDFIISKLMMV